MKLKKFRKLCADRYSYLNNLIPDLILQIQKFMLGQEKFERERIRSIKEKRIKEWAEQRDLYARKMWFDTDPTERYIR